MGTTLGNKDIATTGSGHQTITPPATSLNPPTPPAGPVPVPYPYTARSATASKTEAALKAGGDPVLVKGSVLDVDPPANQPSQPTGGDVVTHAVKGKAKMVEGSSNTKAGGKPVCGTGDNTCVNVMTGNEEVAQERMPILKAGGADMAGDKDGSGADKDEKGKRALPAQQAKKANKTSGPEEPECESDPVAVATGCVVDEGVDLDLPGVMALVWKRSYSSARAEAVGALGRGGWVHTFEQWIEEGEEVTTLHAGDGREIHFAKIAPGESTYHRGEQLTLTADRHGGYTVLIRAAQRSRVFSPLTAGGRPVLRAMRDAYGHEIRLEHEGERLRRVIDTAGREVRVLSDERGRVARLEVWATPPDDPDAAPALWQWVDHAYAPGGELASVTDAVGCTERYGYDALHRMVDKTLPNGVIFRYAFDEETGFCVRAWGEGGLREAHLQPDLEKGTTLASGTHEPKLYTWDRAGRVVKVETHDGSVVRESEYDDDGHLVAESDAAGNKTSYERDALGNVTKVVDAAGNETLIEYAGDHPARRTDRHGLVTEYRHDERGALIGITYPSGAAYSVAHDNDGRPTGVYGRDGALATFAYDAHHNLVHETDARGARSAYTYDALGRALSRTDALGRVTRVEHDRLGRPVAVHDADGTTQHIEYDALGLVCRHTDALGHVTEMEHQGTGVLRRLTRPDGQRWLFSYDADERLRAIKNPRGEEHAFGYDRAGRVERERTFDGRQLEYRYDKAGELARIAYPDATWIEMLRDPLGNIVEEHTPHGDVVFERDPTGRLQKATLTEANGKIVTAFEHDELGRVVAEIHGEEALRFQYDERGHRVARITPDGQTTRFYYDAVGELVAVDHEGHKVLLQHDVLGRETRRHVYQGQVDIFSAWDGADRLVERTAARAGADAQATLSRRAWTYDAAGHVARMDDARWGATEYEHDRIGQLVAAKRGRRHEVFDYDPTGSIRNVLHDLEALGRAEPFRILAGNVLAQTAEARYENDERGRRTRVIPIREGREHPDEATGYVWDCRDRLREVQKPSGERVLYTYDAFGRMVRKEVVPAERADYPRMVELAMEKGKAALPRVRRTELLWDGNALAADREEGRGARVFVHEPGSLVPMLQAEGGEVFTVVNDRLGQPRELLDQEGRVAWSAAVSAFGQVTEVSRDPERRARGLREVESPFRSLGQIADADAGLHVTRFRWFDPALGRWLSPDPLGVLGGANLFGFNGSPVQVVDPLGLLPCSNAKAGGTGKGYDKAKGQGLYVLVDENGVVRYVGRGDAPARGTRHKGDTEKDGLQQVIIFNNNLTKKEAKNLEQRLIDHFGGKNPDDAEGNRDSTKQLINDFNSYDKGNKKQVAKYGSETTDAEFQDVLNRLGQQTVGPDKTPVKTTREPVPDE